MEELLLEFALENGISEGKVTEFLNRKSKISTLEELENLPSELLNHISYISWCPEPLKSYVSDRMWVERYMKIDLERVADCIRDDIDYDINGELLDTDNNRELQEIIECMIKEKFGSVVYDW